MAIKRELIKKKLDNLKDFLKRIEAMEFSPTGTKQFD